MDDSSVECIVCAVLLYQKDFPGVLIFSLCSIHVNCCFTC
uniref:Uncharacterized protein n=1 Tax=Rhizophora mucronata TaxID=61149 RepID=A0A2P2MZ27_RHIMU